MVPESVILRCTGLKTKAVHFIVKVVVIHPKYDNRRLYFDVALLVVEPILFSEFVRPGILRALLIVVSILGQLGYIKL